VLKGVGITALAFCYVEVVFTIFNKEVAISSNFSS